MRKDIKKIVRDGYAQIAKKGTSCCSSSSCCGTNAKDISQGIGYSDDEINDVPDGANLGLGCGNPVALASLKEGDIVLDLGSGAGFDAFLASKKVGGKGRVIGVDMTPEMIERAKKNAVKGNYCNVEFRLGEIESLPVEDSCIDVIISNCVINLSPDKAEVFKEAYRVLKPSGKMMVSDLVLERPLPEKIKQSMEGYVGCLAGAMLKTDYMDTILRAGFSSVEIIQSDYYPILLMANDPNAKVVVQKKAITPADIKDIENTVISIKVKAVKGD